MENFVIYLTVLSVVVGIGLIGSIAALWYRHRHR